MLWRWWKSGSSAARRANNTAEHGLRQPGQWRLGLAFVGRRLADGHRHLQPNAARYLAEEPIGTSAMESTDRGDPRFRNVGDRIDWQMPSPRADRQ